ncbi:MAG: type II toxin-antitoxin system YafQ family toxin [Oscillospiraceae bacterium]
MLKPEYTNRFKHDLKLCEKRNCNINDLKSIIRLLVEEKTLPEKNKDHNLSGIYMNYRECHIAPDWLLIYKCVEGDVIIFVRTGSHSDLF